MKMATMGGELSYNLLLSYHSSAYHKAVFRAVQENGACAHNMSMLKHEEQSTIYAYS